MNVQFGIIDTGFVVVDIFKDNCLPAVLHQLRGGSRGLQNSSPGGQVASQDGNSPLLLEGLLTGKDNVTVETFSGFQILTDGASADGWNVEMEQLRDLLHQRRQAACIIKVLHQMISRGHEVEETGNVSPQSVPIVQLVIDVESTCNRQQVHNGVRRTPDGPIHPNCIFKGLAGQNRRHPEVLRDHCDDAAACLVGKHIAAAVNRWDSGIGGECKAQSLHH